MQTLNDRLMKNLLEGKLKIKEFNATQYFVGKSFCCVTTCGVARRDWRRADGRGDTFPGCAK